MWPLMVLMTARIAGGSEIHDPSWVAGLEVFGPRFEPVTETALPSVPPRQAESIPCAPQTEPNPPLHSYRPARTHSLYSHVSAGRGRAIAVERRVRFGLWRAGT